MAETGISIGLAFTEEFFRTIIFSGSLAVSDCTVPEYVSSVFAQSERQHLDDQDIQIR